MVFIGRILLFLLPLAPYDCLNLKGFIQHAKKIDELDIWGRCLDTEDMKSVCDKIFHSGYVIKDNVKGMLWKNMLGVYHPQLISQSDRQNYFIKLRHVYEKLKKKWSDQRHRRHIRRLYEMVKRDAERTDIGLQFYSGVSNENVIKLINIVVTYVREHPKVSYTQGMTDILSPILYTMGEEADAYICFACLLHPIQENFNPHCGGVLGKIEALKHLCEVLAPDLYHYLENLDQDAFTLCFGMVLIECRREFSFRDSIDLLEVIIASRFGYRVMTQNVVDWADYMTTHPDSKDILEEVILSDVGLSSTIHSVNGDVTEDEHGSDVGHTSNIISSASYTSHPRDTTGYHVSRARSTTPQSNVTRSHEHCSTGESKTSTTREETVNSLKVSPVPPESGVDSSSEGNVLTAYPVQHQSISSSDDGGTTPVCFFDNPQETALEINSGHSSRASSVVQSGRVEESLTPELTETKIEISFPLFICLAILLNHRWQIMHEQIDFIGISGLLNDNMGNLELNMCLEKAKLLKQQYHFLQKERFGLRQDSFSRWLTEEIKQPQYQ